MRALLLLLSSLVTSHGFSVPRRGNRSSSSTTQLRSIPNSFDTLTSGLASIARLPRGVTVSSDGISLSGPAARFLPKIKQLFDVENSRECRVVRERITELDLVVERVIPAAENSRAVARSPITVPTMVAEIDGLEQTFTGVDEILRFLDDKFSTLKKDESKTTKIEISDEEDNTMKVALEKLVEMTTYLPGLLRAGRGSRVCGAASTSFDVPRPAQPLVLYSYEGNQFCRLVREVLTELDLVFELRSAGKMSPRRNELAKIAGGSSQCPYLIDPNTGVKLAESADIISYLYKTYGLWTPPNELLQSISGVVTPLLAPLYRVIAPLQAGSYRENEFEYKSEIAEAKATIYDEILANPVVVYTYEYSPFCSEATALLENCGIQFKEISLGLEWIPGLISEPAKRAALLEITGQSSLPHIFVGGTSIGGLFSGSPGLVPALEQGKLKQLIEDAKKTI
ncbi:hypothetical protein HJC23_003920 [Cyclotella cryptica]|uniref:GST N-terminal domain-containing protein n=1 Tax=Cyclotella cryptica TaxID=29204 RepID=A0ABD3PU54_9STRA|eukprot:CCRYP_011475-RB/>CCRYP_011475-RB protein AED:0.04 eAED:0.04 QI:181/1/1/1/1/1/3/280/453